ncbi:DUF1349 domain-containing protein [Runella slithyformis]|uniref:DUF1349 domain-containing protein n=1 Tax=Runella slithyformis (strain ATCC 29530 / DSM 19594 / LMG 11500 / NCIMB 11436 / LSU 4) TaxID=761193 RepID=A0A7U3ZR00_RUNSL|nr:DUF1349 domain-containing protein [Runella slithyformis]AEI51757.1 protein of unknown function DUF1349 [Runella slithyformis DSM 19594]
MIDFSIFRWLYPPQHFQIEDDRVSIRTEPKTDFWQRTYYGFQNDNAPAFLRSIAEDFTFTVKTTFDSHTQFDQCGVIIYQDSDNWFKASIEYENEHIARLGSVVTNLGYSDWATTDISAEVRTMWYRLSRRGSDFLIENSEDGEDFSQMRIFHLHRPLLEVYFGVYACSPLESSFEAVFTDFRLTESIWQAHPL